MIEPAWSLQRLVFLVALVVVVAFAIWLAVTGSLQAAAWTTYNVTHHCVDVVATRNDCFALGQNYENLDRLARVNRLYAFEWGELDRILGGFGRDGQVTPPA
jgi:lipoprotein signal peptidase